MKLTSLKSTIEANNILALFSRSNVPICDLSKSTADMTITALIQKLVNVKVDPEADTTQVIREIIVVLHASLSKGPLDYDELVMGKLAFAVATLNITYYHPGLELALQELYQLVYLKD